MNAVSRLLGPGASGEGPAEVRERLVGEARGYFRVSRALLLSVDELEGRIEVAAGDPEANRLEELLAIVDVQPVADVIDERRPVHVSGDAAGALAAAIGAGDQARSVLLLPIQLLGSVGYALALLDDREREFTREEAEVAGAFASAAAAGLAQLQSAADHAAQTALQAALARAAKMLNDSLDLGRVLLRICEESTSILDGDVAAVYTGNARDGLRMDAVLGFPPEALGTRLEPGEGLAGKAAESDEPLLTNDYAAMGDRSRSPLFRDIRSSLAVPMHWDGELRGILTVGYTREHRVTRDHLGLLEAFADLAAAACRNASAHAGLALAALTDSLTGCLNHAALHEAVQRETERCRRGGHRLSLALLDLDDFKQVNERQGHLAGDEVLRAAGSGLRGSVRAYDLVARYGGDEFAIVVIDAGETEAAELAGRSLATLGTPATGGVAEWEADESSTQLIERADIALLHAKHHGGRGTVARASEVPSGFSPAPGPDRTPPVGMPPPGGALRPERSSDQTQRLRKRTRQLGLANALGARLAAMTDPREIVQAAVEELHRDFGFYLCAVVRIRDDDYVEDELGWCQPRDAGLIGRCLRERRPVVTGDVSAEPEYQVTPETAAVQSELVVPLLVGGELWGAINLEEVRAEAFDEDDVQVLQTIADQVGSALLSATLYERLERAYQAALSEPR